MQIVENNNHNTHISHDAIGADNEFHIIFGFPCQSSHSTFTNTTMSRDDTSVWCPYISVLAPVQMFHFAMSLQFYQAIGNVVAHSTLSRLQGELQSENFVTKTATATHAVNAGLNSNPPSRQNG